MFSTRRIEGGLGLIPLPWIREINDFQVFFGPNTPLPDKFLNTPLNFSQVTLYFYIAYLKPQLFCSVITQRFSEFTHFLLWLFRILTFFTLTFQNSDIFRCDFSEFRHFFILTFQNSNIFYFNFSEFQHFSLFRTPFTQFYPNSSSFSGNLKFFLLFSISGID